jgi:subtilase family serine protease
MHLLSNIEKTRLLLLKKYFLQMKNYLQQRNIQLQKEKNQLIQEKNLLIQEKSKLQKENTELLQEKSKLLQENIELQELINEKNIQENRDYQEITYHHFLQNNIEPHAPAPKIPASSFNGIQLLRLYNIPTVVPLNSITRKSKIAIIIAYTHKNIKSDLNTYWRSLGNFGPSSRPPNINIYTFPGAISNSGWNLEECLDVQMIATVNPNADISVVETKSSSLEDISNGIKYATQTLNVDVISMSFGANDTNFFLNSNSLFSNPSNSENYKCFCASSGDNNAVCWPSVSSNVLAIGGTSLIWSPKINLPYSRIEYTWEKAGCGYSNTITKPKYQNNINTKNNYRVIPDISLVANPTTGVKIVYNGRWYTIGGTSVSCPLFAGILSLANQQRFNIQKKPLTSVFTGEPVTNVHNHLYNTIYNNSTLRNICLTDVMLGNDGIYSAGIGYDVATGVGTPNATSLCNVLTNNVP